MAAKTLPIRLEDVAAIVNLYRDLYRNDSPRDYSDYIMQTIGEYVLTLAFIDSTNAGEIDATDAHILERYESALLLPHTAEHADAIATLEFLACCGALERIPADGSEYDPDCPPMACESVLRSPALDGLS